MYNINILPLHTVTNRRKKQLKILAVICIIVMFFCITNVFADWGIIDTITGWFEGAMSDIGVPTCNCGALDHVHKYGQEYPCVEGWGDLKVWCYDAYFNVTSGQYGSLAMDFLYELDYTPADKITAGNGSNSMFGYLWSMVVGAQKAFIPVGVLLVFIFFLIDFIEKATHETMNFEVFLKQFIKFFIAIVIITNIVPILEFGMSLNNALLKTLVDPSKHGDSTSNGAMAGLREQIYYELADKNIIDIIFKTIKSLFSYLLVALPVLIAMIILLSRYIELAARAMVAPIGVASLFDGGTRSTGIRFLKKFFACCLHGFMIAIIMTCYYLLSTAMNAHSADISAVYQTFNILIGIALCLPIIKSKSYVNDILGVT